MVASIIIATMEVTMAKHGPDQNWRQHIIDNVLPKMEATTEQTTSFQPATAADFGPVAFYGNRSPDDPAALLPDAAATKTIAIGQRFTDLFATVPTSDEVQEIRLEVIGLKNRIADLERHQSEGGFGLDASAPQVRAERKKLERAEKELARVTELKETRTVRSTATGQFRHSVNDWVLRGIPNGCTLDVVEDAPLSELVTKADGGRIEAAVERYRLRQRELAAAAHRVNSAQWAISGAEADAVALIERRAEAGRPNLENAIEHGMPISFAMSRLTALVHNAQPGAVAFIEAEDAVGLVCWLFEKELLAKISAGFREISDGDENALDARQREEMLATIALDSLAAERAECALIWHAAAKGEVIDFRPTTTPAAAIGVALRTLPRAAPSPSSPEHAFDIVQPGGGRR
jgi:hypothetical protein